MRVLYFSRDYTPHDHRFLTALAASEHTIGFLRLERSARQTEERALPPEVQQIAWRGGQHPFRWGHAPALVADLRRVVRTFKPDLIHAGPIQSAAFLAALSGFRPLVSMSWGSDLLVDAERSAWMKAITRFTLGRSRLLVGDCQAVQRKAAELGYPEQCVRLFPWGVDLQHFSPAAEPELRQRLGWQDAFVLLSLRSWEPIYGVDVLVRAFALAAAQAPELRLFLLGGGSQAAQLRQILMRAGLLDRVHFGGQVGQANLPHYYRAADLYLSASHSDGSSVSLMEALACGRPVLVSDIPGNLEWIIPGQQGWLFADGSAEALAQGILRAYQLRASLPVMASAARALAERRANWTKNFNVLLRAYSEALEPKD